MAKRQLPSPEVLRQLLTYDPETGKLFWKERGPEWSDNASHLRQWNSRYAGKEALNASDGDGYKMGRILGRKYRSHRVIWAMCNGAWPVDQVDHIDGDRANNRISNLREATNSQNSHNRSAQSNNTSGFKGVSWNKCMRKWEARTQVNGRIRHLGYFSTPEAAFASYSAAAKKFHGDFARTL